ncbi:uncharacterized protein LOC126176566 [Schistocerca cancellata]|uniref:uncharacterized protein LOC126176566 n=1 Tax=Schistocerca cancellata TaxID=274614 RepID=UPI002119775C|nr:uncharacterized protein LOC126176566 [Schistocerca cancellata]
MAEWEIPDKLIKLTEICVTESNFRLTVQREFSKTFEVKTEVRQGDIISPSQSNLALNNTLKRVIPEYTGVTIGKKINVLAFTDDTMVIRKSMEDLEKMGTVLVVKAKKVSLSRNESKTKFLVIGGRDLLGRNHLSIRNLTIQKTDVFITSATISTKKTS